MLRTVLLKEIPFLRIVIPVCAGIISALYMEPGRLLLLIFSLLLSAVVLLTMFFGRNQTNVVFGLTLTLALIQSGHLLYSHEKNSLSTLEKTKSDIICTLSDYPEQREKSYRAKVRLIGLLENDSIKPVTGSMLIYFGKNTTKNVLLPGDILKIRCIPSEIQNRGNPFEFDYRFFMENQGIKYMAFINEDDVTGHFVPEKRKITHKALIIREKIIEMYRNRGITGRKLALVAAMTVGEKSMLEPDQRENFIKAGVMHIMAVSGLHAVVLSLFVFNILFFLKQRLNILRILIATMILWAFAFVTGLTPSVMRATLMFSFIQAGNLMKRPANSLNSVLSSAFILILIRPSVIFDAGFLLSYSAVIFIIIFYKEFYQMLQLKNWLADKIWQSLVVTFVAQAGTFPLTVMLFNRFPAYFLLTNMIIVPLSSLIIITGSIVPLIYPVVFISEFLGEALNYMTGFTEFLTEKAASLPGSSVGGIGMTVSECIFLTAIIATLCFVLINRRDRTIKYLLVLVLIISITSTYKDISTRTSSELIVYNTPGRTVTGIRTGKILNLFTAANDIPDEVLRHTSTLGLKIKKTDNSYGDLCISVGGRKILITRSIGGATLLSLSPDIVILTGSIPQIKECSALQKYPELIILSSEVASGFRLSDEFRSIVNKPVYSIRQSGAFTMSL